MNGNPRISTTEMLILSAMLQRGEQYGLEIVRTIKDISEGRRNVSFGGLYVQLQRMEQKGLVESRWGEESVETRRGARRRYYKLTALGRLVVINESGLFAGNLMHLYPSPTRQG